jgi:hypothetical protein
LQKSLIISKSPTYGHSQNSLIKDNPNNENLPKLFKNSNLYSAYKKDDSNNRLENIINKKFDEINKLHLR